MATWQDDEHRGRGLPRAQAAVFLLASTHSHRLLLALDARREEGVLSVLDDFCHRNVLAGRDD